MKSKAYTNYKLGTICKKNFFMKNYCYDIRKITERTVEIEMRKNLMNKC